MGDVEKGFVDIDVGRGRCSQVTVHVHQELTVPELALEALRTLVEVCMATDRIAERVVIREFTKALVEARGGGKNECTGAG